MNDKQENFLSMLDVLVNLCNEHLSLINGVTGFANKYTQLLNRRNQIRAISQLLQFDVSGTTLTKNDLKMQMANDLYLLSSVIRSYAHSKGDMELEMEVKISLSDLKRLRDEEMTHKANAFYTKAAELQAELADYGITNALLDEVQAQIALYMEFEQKPKTVRLNMKQKRAIMQRLIDECFDFLRYDMDRAAEIFRKGHPDFYAMYKYARKTDKTGRKELKKDEAETTTGAIDVTIVDSETLSPILDAVFEIKTLELSNDTDEDGNGYFDSIAPGTYVLSVSHEDYVSKEVEVVIVAGETLELEVKLEQEADSS